MNTLSVGQALIISIWIGLVMARVFFGGATTTLRFTPMMTGLICGIVMKDVKTAMEVSAAIQLIYMGVFSPGGQMPSEPAIAAGIAVPVALMSSLEPEAAVAVAVPVGLLGSYLYQFRFFINTFVVKLTDKYAEEVNSSKLTFSIIVLPVLVSFAIFIPFMFVALYYGAPIIASLVESASGGILFHVLTVIGGGLAAIGIAVTVYVIGKKNYIVFFLLAYFLTTMLKSLNITNVTYAILGLLIAAIYVLSKKESSESV